MRWIGALLILLGTLALVYGGFWYTKEETKAAIGPLKVQVEERHRVNVPLWAGVGAVVGGTLILVLRGRRA